METMMLKKLQGPALNIADIRRNIRTIDHICLICFGRSEYLELAGDVLCYNSLKKNDILALSGLLESTKL